MALQSLLSQFSQELQNASPSNLLLLLSLLFFTYSFLVKLTRGTNLRLPPSPPRLPIVGNLHQLGTLPHRSLHALSLKYGPLMLVHLGTVRTLVVSTAEMASEIMTTHDIAFADRVRPQAAEIFFCGSSGAVFCPYGDYWRHVRKICVVELLSLKRVQSFQFIRVEETAILIEKIRSSCLNGAPVVLGEMLLNVTSNIISRAAIGRGFEAGTGKESFGECSRRAMELSGVFCFKNFFPSLGWMDVLTGFDAKLKETSKVLHDFVDQVISEHQIARGNDNQSDKIDFVEILLDLQKDGILDINLTKENIRAIILDMLVAGTDTSALTMEWAMAALMKNPTVMNKAQEEVRRVVGKKLLVDEADINQMDYLKCVIKETLRLYPPGPFLIPHESTASVTLEGYEIPPKTGLYINIWAIQRDPKFWDKPGEFFPERFINSPVDFKGQDFQFIPFGAGRRICPGIKFGTTLIAYVLANLLYWFDWELPNGARGKDLDMSEVFGLSVHKKIPLRLVPLLHSS